MRMPCALSSCRVASRRTLVLMSSASEATGSTCTTTSASGSTPRTAASTASEISCTFSKGTARSTVIVTSANTSGPLRRSRSLRISPRPATCRTASSTFPCRPVGTLSNRSSIDFFPSCTLTQTTMPATHRAATESALSSQFSLSLWATSTHARPKNTTSDDHTSVEKCSASASSAWLLYFKAACFNALDREISTTIETAITAKAQKVGCTSTAEWKKSR